MQTPHQLGRDARHRFSANLKKEKKLFHISPIRGPLPPPLGGGKTPIFLRHFDFFGLPRKVRTNHPSYPPRNGSETPCDPKIHAKGDSEYEKMQKNSEKVAF